MKKIKQISFIFFVICLVINVMSFSVYAQPTIPKEKIPENTPSDVKKNIERLYSSNPVNRGYGAFFLGEMGKRSIPAVPFLIGILHDSSQLQWRDNPGKAWWLDNTSPGREAERALVKIGEPAVEPLIAALNDEGPRIRNSAVKVLGEIGDARAVVPLSAALKDERIGVRQKAAEALGKIGDARAVEPLIAALKDEDIFVRSYAAEALGKITGQDFGEDQTKWQNWWNKNKDEMLKKR